MNISLVTNRNLRILVSLLVLSLGLATTYRPLTTHAAPTSFTKTVLGYSENYRVAVDSLGNRYTTGVFLNASVNFNPDGSDLHSSNGSGDMFLTKWNADGTYGWTKTFGGTGGDFNLWGLSIDGNNNVYVGGRFSSASINFNPDGNDVHTNTGTADSFFSKWNADGTYGWTKTLQASSGSVAVESLFATASGDLFLTGQFSGLSVNFDPNGSALRSSGSTATDVFLLKINSGGTFAWVKTFGTSGYDYGTSVTVTSTGIVSICGKVAFDANNAHSFNMNPDGTDIRDISNSGVGFLTSWTTSGSYIGGKMFGGTAVYPHSITHDANNNIYQTGTLRGANSNFNPAGSDIKSAVGDYDGFLTKWNADGTYGWTRIIGGDDYDTIRGVTTDSAGDIYIGGITASTNTNFNPTGSDILSNINYEQFAFVSKWKPDGSYRWTRTFGGPTPETTLVELYGLTTAPGDDIYAGGSFKRSVDFNNGLSTPDIRTSTPYPYTYNAYLTKIIPPTWLIKNLDNTLAATTVTSSTSATSGEGFADETVTGIRLSTSTTVPLATVSAEFSSNLDWTPVTGQSDVTSGKSFVHNLASAPGAPGSYTLYVPYLSQYSSVAICPGATSLTELTVSCPGIYYRSVGDPNTSIVTISGGMYWAVSGLTGTGGFSAAIPSGSVAVQPPVPTPTPSPSSILTSSSNTPTPISAAQPANKATSPNTGIAPGSNAWPISAAVGGLILVIYVAVVIIKERRRKNS